MRIWPVDDLISCHACHGRCHDAWDDGRNRPRGVSDEATLLMCNYCGIGVWEMNVPPPPQEKNSAVRKSEGRYAGMTIGEIDAVPGGRKYLEVIANRDGSFREVASLYLAALQ